MLDPRDAHPALADAQAHPRAGAHAIRHLDGKRHVRSIGGGGDDQRVDAHHFAIGRHQLHQHRCLGGLDQAGDDHTAPLDQLVGRGLLDHQWLAQVTAGGDLAWAHREQEQVLRVDRHRHSLLVIHADAQLGQLRHSSQLENDLLVQVDPVGGVADDLFDLAEQQARFTTRLQRLHPDLDTVGAGWGAAHVGHQLQRRSHLRHRPWITDLHTRVGDGWHGGERGRARRARRNRGLRVAGVGEAGDQAGSDGDSGCRRSGAGSGSGGEYRGGRGGGRRGVGWDDHRGGRGQVLPPSLDRLGDQGGDVFHRVGCGGRGIGQAGAACHEHQQENGGENEAGSSHHRWVRVGSACSLSPWGSQSVDAAVLLGQVAHIGCRVDLRAGHALDQVLRLELVAVYMHLFPQPVEPGGELALADLLGQVGDVGQDALPQLCADQVAQGIAGEVADIAARPVHVLQHAPGVIGWGDAQVLLEACVPRFGQVLHLQLALDHGDLQLHAQHDMQVIGGFIGFHPDQRGLDLVDALVECLQRDVAELGGEEFLQAGVEVLPEGIGAPDQVLPHARLGFVDAGRSATVERGAVERLVGSHVIHGVPGLMQRAEQRRSHVIGVHTSGDAHIPPAEAGGEGVQGLVLAAAFPMVAHLGDGLHAKVPLFLLIVGQGHEGIVHLGLAGDLLDQCHLLGAQEVENGLYIGGLQTGLKDPQQRVVFMVVGCKIAGIAVSQVEDLFQVRLEGGEVILCPRFRPGFVGGGGDDGVFSHPIEWHLRLAIVFTPGHPYQAGIERIWVQLGGVRLEVVQQPADLFGDELGMGDLLQGSQLIATVLSPGGRHIGLLVPAKQGNDLVQVGDLSQEGLELLKLLFRSHRILELMILWFGGGQDAHPAQRWRVVHPT